VLPADAAAFLDVRAHGFARVAVCIPELRVGDPAFNARAHVRALADAYDAGAHYALCPELGLTAYTCSDLFFHEVLQKGALAALAEVAERTAPWNLALSVGLPLAVEGLLFNCAVTLYGGRPLAAVPKAYPPNYREFYELRWFAPAARAPADAVPLLGARVPFGTDVLVALPHVPGFVLHTDVCEDLWVPVPPGTRAALAGATVLANLSASNVTVAKHEYRRELVRGSSAKNLAVQMYSAAGFGESTADLAWDGHGMIADRGEIVAETPRFALTGSTAVADVDLPALLTDRMRQTSFGANAAHHRAPCRTVVVTPLGEQRDAGVFHRLVRAVAPHPFVPGDPAARDERCREVFQILSTSLARRVRALPPEQRRLIVGVSGGQDSSLAMLVAGHAMDLLGTPRADVVAVTMPGFGTSPRTYRNARALAEALGASLREIDIRDIAGRMLAAVAHDPAQHDVTYENVQAWARKFLLFSVASHERGIDLGTGDLSELALGWSTYGGDHMSHYGVNAGVPKTLVSELIRWAADTVFAREPTADVLRDVLATPISPELLPLAGEEIAQRTESVLGPYELHDFFLYHFVRFGFGPRRIARLAWHAFGGQYTVAEIRRRLVLFLERVFANQFKRDCVPGSPKVGSGGSLSPRGDWRMPADATPDGWLAEARAIPDVASDRAPGVPPDAGGRDT
jgi:NAD+ synthase (glutamine-hydrolysing)